MTNFNYRSFQNDLRETLGIVVDFKNNDLFTYRTKNINYSYDNTINIYYSITDMYQKYYHIKNKIDLCYNIYSHLVSKDNEWLNYPVYKNLWNFKVNDYHFKKKINSEVYVNEGIENKEYSLKLSTMDILDNIILCQQSTVKFYFTKQYYVKMLLSRYSIDWNKIISSSQSRCPNCNCILNFSNKTCLINKIKIFKNYNQYRMTGLLHCKQCTIFDSTKNKKILNSIDNTLTLLSNQLINNLFQKNTIIPKYYRYILNSQDFHIKHSINDMIIVFLQLKKFMKAKLNILFKIVIIYLI